MKKTRYSKYLLMALTAVLCLGTLSACGAGEVSIAEEGEEVDESLIPKEERLNGHKYDFLDFLNLGIQGADGIARVEVAEMKKVKAKDFDNDKDFVRIKQIFTGALIDIDIKENLKNGDKIKITFTSRITLSDEDYELINLTPYTYEVSGLEKGTKYDLDKDIKLNIYSFEPVSEAKTKAESNDGYSMIIKSIASLDNSNVDVDYLGGVRTLITADDKVFDYGETLYEVTYGFANEYLIANNLTLKQIKKKTGLEPCTQNIDGQQGCAVTEAEILKAAPIAELPNFNYVDKEVAAQQILSFINARFEEIDYESLSIDDEELTFESFEEVHGVYKYNRIETGSGEYEHAEMYNYRYGALVSATNSDNKKVYCLVTMGMLQDGESIGLFTGNEGNLNVTMVEAGLSKNAAITTNEDSGYTLSSISVF